MNSQGLQKRSHVKGEHIFFANEGYSGGGVSRRTGRLWGEHVHRTGAEGRRLTRDLIGWNGRWRCDLTSRALIGGALRLFCATLARERAKFAAWQCTRAHFGNRRIMARFHVGVERGFLGVAL